MGAGEGNTLRGVRPAGERQGGTTVTYTDVATRLGAPEPALADRATDTAPRVAVLVCHGMGQQVPFETVDLVAHALRDAAGTEPTITTEVVRLDLRGGSHEMLMRSTLRLLDGEGRAREVDLFEAYWAPLTEGRVTSLDVFWFLIEAGVNGVTYAWPGKKWQRWLFGRMHSFDLTAAAIWRFLAAWAVFLALVTINTTIATVTAAALLFGPSGAADGWPSAGLVGDLTVDLVVLLGGGVVPGVLVGALTRGREPRWQRGTWRHRVLWALVYAALGATIVTGLLMGLHLVQHTLGWGGPFSGWRDWLPGEPWIWLVRGAVWGGAFVGAEVARRLFVQYLGDVAAYVSAHSVNKFAEVREAIKEASYRVGHAVYGATDARGGWLYESVVVVGHSLGSVVAYDTLNRLINEDFANTRAGKELEALGVVARTPLLLTFGSPLDKTAFVFTAQAASSAQVREAAAAAKQPLIVDYAQRPARWVNIYSPDDWISGKLAYYDDPDPRQGARQRICNREDRDACTPLLAHTEYWRNTPFLTTLHNAVTGRGPGGARVAEGAGSSQDARSGEPARPPGGP